MKQTKKVWKPWTAWADDRATNWFEDMARQGWHVASLGVFTTTFEKGIPRESLYRFDFRPGIKDKDEYFGMFTDAGWDYVGSTASWYLFRTDASSGASSEIFSDAESAAAKYGRVLIFCGLFFMFSLMNPDRLAERMPGWDYGGRLSERTGWVGTVSFVAFWINLVVAVLLGYGCLQLVRALRRAKSGRR